CRLVGVERAYFALVGAKLLACRSEPGVASAHRTGKSSAVLGSAGQHHARCFVLAAGARGRSDDLRAPCGCSWPRVLCIPCRCPPACSTSVMFPKIGPIGGLA